MIILFLNLLVLVCFSPIPSARCELNKNYFPDDFLFGVASSAYQIEGGHDADGKGPSIQDVFTEKYPEKFNDRSNGDVACNSFKKFREDVKLVKNLGVNFYRFSISWSRILPNGFSDKLNIDGLRYYNDLINELVSNGIEPMVTMYHYDLPMALQEIGGWTNPYLAYYFEDYARVLYSYFGDRVKYWVTLNGGCAGYGDGNLPPFLERYDAKYLCHNVMLLAHAKAYHLYDNEFRSLQKGKIGLTLDGNWYESGSFSIEDIKAGERAREFKLGIMANPIYHVDGGYPSVVRERVDNISSHEGYLRSRLPILTPEEMEYIQGTYDYFGINMYTTYLVKDVKESSAKNASVEKDMKASLYQDRGWSGAKSAWLKVYPSGLRKILNWIKDKYDNPDIYVLENGFSDGGEINDINRIKYLQQYMSALLEAIHEDNVSVKGYAVWSLLDNFEWLAGYSEKFGLYHVDFSDPHRKRTAKKSAKWYKQVIKARRVVEIDEVSSQIKGEL